MITGLQLIEKEISASICDQLDKVGLLYRIFSRTKDNKSLVEKVNRKIADGVPYSSDGKKMQDLIGIRIVTYFQDDIKLVRKILSKKFKFIDEEIDIHELTVFKPKRTNIICELDKKLQDIFLETKSSSDYKYLEIADKTFELQLRTILSEGWHEIDHSLRYKCKSDWENHYEKERMLNGIYASLEVNDLALKSLFSELSYQHFKTKNWEAMLRNKFRLKFHVSPLREDIKAFLDKNNDLAKRILKLDREKIISKIADSDLSIPINFNNLIYIINLFELHNVEIDEITPSFIKKYNFTDTPV